MCFLGQSFSTPGCPIGCDKKTKTATTFSDSKVEHRHNKSVASFELARVRKSIIYLMIKSVLR